MDWRSTDSGLEEAMWQLNLQSHDGKVIYPERPGETDCSYYLQTGVCGFGMNCRFNHPRNRNLVAGVPQGAGHYPERPGEPECQYFLKTGLCKFGATCKYHHPRYKAGIQERLQLNLLGFPLRPNEKECSYYIKTGQCKYGITCKFHHPQPAGAPISIPASPFNTSFASLSAPRPQTYAGGLSAISIPRTNVVSNSYVQGSPGYLPFVLSQGVMPLHGWSSFSPGAQMGPIASDTQQQMTGTGLFFGPQYTKDGTTTCMPGLYASYLSPAAPLGIEPPNVQAEQMYPQRPGQQECLFYMRTGYCKFGSTCKYHHPRERNVTSQYPLSPVGLPLRQGVPTCPFYARQGFCKYGPTCKYDHPIGTLSYSPSASSLADMPVAPYPIGSATTTIVSSSSDMHGETSTEGSKESVGTSQASVINVSSKSQDPGSQSPNESSLQHLNSSEDRNDSSCKTSNQLNVHKSEASKEEDELRES
eukprot:TRINITY_DN8028_c0_g1_i1.p1 TRINITY_DN8028_c0_g1~~TRINITY_DN8028_c0_g1_i1.p1  ORF type:complete len:474 (-),score=90.36 TRINITY_DN8028_c0_g1_i1:546-1967(-)